MSVTPFSPLMTVGGPTENHRDAYIRLPTPPEPAPAPTRRVQSIPIAMSLYQYMRSGARGLASLIQGFSSVISLLGDRELTEYTEELKRRVAFSELTQSPLLDRTFHQFIEPSWVPMDQRVPQLPIYQWYIEPRRARVHDPVCIHCHHPNTYEITRALVEDCLGLAYLSSARMRGIPRYESPTLWSPPLLAYRDETRQHAREHNSCIVARIDSPLVHICANALIEIILQDTEDSPTTPQREFVQSLIDIPYFEARGHPDAAKLVVIDSSPERGYVESLREGDLEDPWISHIGPWKPDTGGATPGKHERNDSEDDLGYYPVLREAVQNCYDNAPHAMNGVVIPPYMEACMMDVLKLLLWSGARELPYTIVHYLCAPDPQFASETATEAVMLSYHAFPALNSSDESSMQSLQTDTSEEPRHEPDPNDIGDRAWGGVDNFSAVYTQTTKYFQSDESESTASMPVTPRGLEDSEEAILLPSSGHDDPSASHRTPCFLPWLVIPWELYQEGIKYYERRKVDMGITNPALSAL